MMCYENSEEEKYENGEEENKQESQNPDDDERLKITWQPQGTQAHFEHGENLQSMGKKRKVEI